jgi:hypothetical protein
MASGALTTVGIENFFVGIRRCVYIFWLAIEEAYTSKAENSFKMLPGRDTLDPRAIFPRPARFRKMMMNVSVPASFADVAK